MFVQWSTLMPCHQSDLTIIFEFFSVWIIISKHESNMVETYKETAHLVKTFADMFDKQLPS